jgi:PKD repeat protein
VVVNPVVPPGGALYCYQLKVSNSIGSTTNAAVYMNYADLPLTPPGLWTANFQETNNIGANQSIGGGLGHYVGRGILGSGMYWNVLPHILTSVNPWNSDNVTNVTDLRDDGVTHSGITCVMNNGGSYNSYGGSLANTSDIRNLLDQYMRNYNPNNGQNVLQFFNVPDGTYNLVCYGGNGATSQGADNYGTTFVVHDPVNGDQTNSTSEPTFQTDALTEGVNFVTFTNVHVAGGTVSVDVRPNFVADPSAGSGGCIEAAQIQLVHYDPLVAAFNGGPASISAGQTAIFTNTSTGFVTNSVWTFGDGFSVTNSSNASVSHSYTNVGTYTVSLTVSGPGGLPSSVTQAGYIVVTAPPTAPSIGSAKLANGSLVFSGSGTAGQPYRVLTSTNLTLPMASWIPVWTNTVTADGSYSYTNSSLTNAGSFFRLVTP